MNEDGLVRWLNDDSTIGGGVFFFPKWKQQQNIFKPKPYLIWNIVFLRRFSNCDFSIVEFLTLQQQQQQQMYDDFLNVANVCSPIFNVCDSPFS